MTDLLGGHTLCVDTLRGVGITPPAAWLAVRDRFDALRLAGTPMLDRLTAAVCDGTSDDIPALYAAAIAEADWEHSDAVLTPLRHRVAGKLVELYAPHATGNYRTVAEQFNNAAASLSEAARVIDIEAPAAVVVEANPKNQKLWRDAPSTCQTMDSLLDALAAAAQMAGAPGDCGDMAFDRTQLLLPLNCTNLDTLHRRRTWAAFNDLDEQHHELGLTTKTGTSSQPKPPRRCGRWSRLISLGAKIHATSNPAAIQLSAPPAERGVRFVIDPNTADSNPSRTTRKTATRRWSPP